MTFHHVDVVHYTHTCPAGAEPHVWQTVRTLVTTIPGGTCQTPKTWYTDDTMTVEPCHRLMPTTKQCQACRPYIIERTVTTIHTGQVNP